MTSQDLSQLAISRESKAFASARRKRRWILWLAIALVLAAVAAYAMTRKPGSIEAETALVAQAWPSQAITVLNATGYVTAQRKAAVSTKATGRLEQLNVVEGSKVKEGEVIARLENRDTTVAVQQARAGVNAAKANLEQGMAELRDADAAYKRALDLAQKNFISQSSVDQAAARLDKAKAAVANLNAAIGVAQAQVRAAEVSLDQSFIRAPFDGVILTKSANVGDIITPFSSAQGTTGAVVTMADMTTLEVDADVAEANLAKVNVGMPAEVTFDSLPDVRLPASVNRMVPTLDRTKATILVKVSFKERDARVLPDMSAKIAFLKRELTAEDRKPFTAVRADAIVEREGKKTVFVVNKDNAAEAREVKTGDAVGELVRVDGVKPGEKVVLKPTERVRNGVAIALAKK